MFLGPNGRRLLDPVQSYCRRAMTVATCAFFFFLLAQTSVYSASPGHRRTVVEVEGGPDGVVWIVQLSDLHFSVFHPDRALDFRRLIGPALSMINPSLVLITGDLTDGKSKDLLTMKQEEAEWIEYQNVTEDVIMRSGLDKNVFYDLRGNHDSFGVPEVGGEKDLYRKYSINGRLRRDENVQSVTLKHMGRKHVFVGIDSFMEIGLRGPTNLFGHPTDELLSDLDVELGQWDASFKETVKIAFGHFPLSFTTTTATGKNIKDVFLKHSLSAYLCGHLHTRFGKNLKRHHVESTGTYFQFNMHQENPNDKNNGNCSANAESSKEFWEWEMGDWRKSRSLRIVAIDSGHVSFLDLNFQLGSMDTIILPTFPLDSRFMHRISSLHDFPCRLADTSSLETVRALIFSRRLIVSVSLKIYDSRSGHFHLVLDQEMIKLKKGNKTRGDMYVAPWNWRAFTDPSPDRFLMQIEATDVSGKYTYSQPRPFSINGLTADTNWKWKEFFVMGVQWGALYYPLLHIVLTLLFTLLLIPRVFLHFSKSYTAYNKNNPAGSRGKSFFVGFVDTGFFILVELCRLAEIWWGILFYLIYLMFLPWFFGYVSVEDGEMSYMSRRGWSVSSSRNGSRNDYVGVPDIMVIVLPHLGFVVVPTVLVVGALAAERTAYRAHIHSLSGKKEDDDYKESKRYVKFRRFSDAFGFWSGRWIRKLLLFICLLILWKHWKQCRALVKAYDMNPFLHSPVFCFWIPLLVAYTIYKTSSVK